MKPHVFKSACSVSLLWCALAGVQEEARGQSAPTVAAQISQGRLTLALIGETGSVYSVQYVTDLSATNGWTDRTLLKMELGTNYWTDPLPALTTGQRFYRAVSMTPDNTNLVFIQPGTFLMGSPSNELDRLSDEGPQTLVTISRGFWMSKYLVTQQDFQAVMGYLTGLFQPKNGYSDEPTRPVDNATMTEIMNYCTQFTAQEIAAGRIPTNCVYRLPTEAEWEYACRAGTTTRFYYGDDPDYSQLSSYAWYWGTTSTTMPVGQLIPNPWGLYDVAGNVYEWCGDAYGPYPGGSVVDPIGAGPYRVLRGGGWSDFAYRCRSAARRRGSGPDINTGFRVVLGFAQH